MTVKEHLQQQMLSKIEYCYENLASHQLPAARSCTSIAEQCMGEFAEWKADNFIELIPLSSTGKSFYRPKKQEFYNKPYSIPELVQLYLNQTK